MNVTQNADGSLSVDIPYADLAAIAGVTLTSTPISSPNFLSHVATDLGFAVGAAVRSANLVFDQVMTDAVAVTVQAIKADRDTAIAAAVVVAAPIKAGP